MKLADGSIRSLDGEIQLDVEMNGKIIPMSAYLLAGKGASFVLGYPAFWDNDWLIHIRQKRLVKPDGTIVADGGDYSYEETNDARRNTHDTKFMTDTEEKDNISSQKLPSTSET